MHEVSLCIGPLVQSSPQISDYPGVGYHVMSPGSPKALQIATVIKLDMGVGGKDIG